MKYLWLLALSLTLMNCASNPHKAVAVNPTLDLPAPVNGGNIGIKNGDMTYIKTSPLSEELRLLENDVYSLEAQTLGGHRYLDNRGLYGVLKDCQVERSKVENGGDGKLLWTESRSYVVPEEVWQEVGINNNQLIAMQSEFIKDRMTRFTQYKQILITRHEELENKIKVCELSLKSQQNN